MLAQILRGQLIGRAVGNNMENKEEDVRQVKRALSLTGRFDQETPPEPHGIITRDMDEAIKGFQREEGLKIDGVLRPGGETEQSLLDHLAESPFMQSVASGFFSPDGTFSPEEEKRRDSIEIIPSPDLGRNPELLTLAEGDGDGEGDDGGNGDGDGEPAPDPNAPEPEPEDPKDPDEPKDPKDPDDPKDPEKDCSDIEAALAEAKAERASLESSVDAVTARKAELEASIANAEALLAEREAKAAEIQAEMDELGALQKEENKDRFIAKKIGEGAGNISGRRGGPVGSFILGVVGEIAGGAIEEADDAMSGRKTDSEIAQRLSALENQLGAIQADIEVIQQEIEPTQEQIAGLEETITRLQGQVDEMTGRIESLQDALDKCQGEGV